MDPACIPICLIVFTRVFALGNDGTAGRTWAGDIRGEFYHRGYAVNIAKTQSHTEF